MVVDFCTAPLFETHRNGARLAEPGRQPVRIAANDRTKKLPAVRPMHAWVFGSCHHVVNVAMRPDLDGLDGEAIAEHRHG